MRELMFMWGAVALFALGVRLLNVSGEHLSANYWGAAMLRWIVGSAFAGSAIYAIHLVLP